MTNLYNFIDVMFILIAQVMELIHFFLFYAYNDSSEECLWTTVYTGYGKYIEAKRKALFFFPEKVADLYGRKMLNGYRKRSQDFIE